jgi:hypothetical protein
MFHMADINARNVNNQQPLDIATGEEVKRVLQEEFYDRPFRSITLDLLNAAIEGDLRLVQVLLLVDRGAKPDDWEYYTHTFFFRLYSTESSMLPWIFRHCKVPGAERRRTIGFPSNGRFKRMRNPAFQYLHAWCRSSRNSVLPVGTGSECEPWWLL